MDLQPILVTKDQYKEILRALAAYQLIKKVSTVPDFKTAEVGAYIIEQGNKFGFEKVKMGDMDWFDEINEEVFELLFNYSQEEMWQHLANMLAHRDAKEGAGGLDKNLIDEETKGDLYLDMMGHRVQKYLKEFAQNGPKNITVRI